MRLSQSVVLWQGRGGIQKIALFVKYQVHIMARTAQISKVKWQSIITLRQEGQSIRKMSSTLTVQTHKPSSAMMKLAFMRTATVKEDAELPLLQRISSLELPASEIAAQINYLQSSSNRHISTSTVQSRLCESGLHDWIAVKTPLPKDTNNKKRLAWSRNTSNGH